MCSYISSSLKNLRRSLLLKGPMTPATSSSHLIWHGHFSGSSPENCSTVSQQRRSTNTTAGMHQTEREKRESEKLFHWSICFGIFVIYCLVYITLGGFISSSSFGISAVVDRRPMEAKSLWQVKEFDIL